MFESREERLHLCRAAVAFFALLIAAGHLAYVTASSSSFTPPVSQATNHTQTYPSNQVRTGFGASSFNTTGFWFDVEIIAYTLIAVVFLLGLRTWYPLSILFNIFNLGIYFLSGITAIPGISGMAFPGRFNLMSGLSSINIIIIGWILFLILSLVLYKYDPGSELDKLLVTRKGSGKRS